MKKIYVMGIIIFITIVMISGFCVVRKNTLQKAEEITSTADEVKQEMEETVEENVEIITEVPREQEQEEIKETEKTESSVPKKQNEESKVGNSNTSIKSEVPNTTSSSNQSSGNEVKEEQNSQPNMPIIEEPKVEVIDQEYERLMKQVQYSTYEQCLNAGFEIALSDTVNILGFDPVEVIYKGKVLGYKLVIRYSNPMN